MVTPVSSFDIPPHILRKALPLKVFPELMRSYNGPDETLITKRKQIFQLNELAKDMRCSEFACIAGTKTDTTPKRLAAKLWDIKVPNEKRPLRTAWFSMRYSGSPIVDDVSFLRERRINVAFITNVLPDSSIQRIEKLRDAIDVAANLRITCILVMGGMEPYQFCVERLRVAPAYGFYLESTR